MPKVSYYNFLKILLHVFMWVVFVLFIPWIFNYLNEFSDYGQMIITSLLLVGIFYLNYYLLIPRLLSQKKFKEYAGAIVMVLLVAYVISYFNKPEPPNFHDKMQPPPGMNFEDFPNHELPKRPFFFNFGILILSTISLAMSTSIRGTREWFSNEKRLKEIENQKLTAELSYLKAQINPHFFFNTLNGIYALARHKSDQTPEVILKLSDLMRYIIYETNTPKVLLSRELAHIQNYIDLQKIRLNEMVKVNYEVSGNPGILQIEPLLFSVFLENAFKHGIDYRGPSAIDIKLSIDDRGLTFVVKNPIPNSKRDEKDGHSGVGLKNIKQRLDLIYGNRHKLKIYELDNQHIVDLYLDLYTDEAGIDLINKKLIG